MKIIEKNTNRGTTNEYYVLYSIPIDSIASAKEALRQLALNAGCECESLGTSRHHMKQNPELFSELSKVFKDVVNDDTISDDAVIDLSNNEIIYNGELTFSYDGHLYEFIN